MIAQELGAKASKSYPDDRFDILWTLKHERIISKESEMCPGIDYYRYPPDIDLEIESDEEAHYAELKHENQIYFGLD